MMLNAGQAAAGLTALSDALVSERHGIWITGGSWNLARYAAALQIAINWQPCEKSPRQKAMPMAMQMLAV